MKLFWLKSRKSEPLPGIPLEGLSPLKRLVMAGHKELI
jgi:hypothetical protein